MKAIDAQKPCSRCGEDVPAFPASRKYCVTCRRAVTLEQRHAHSAERRSRIPETYPGICRLCGSAYSYPSGRGNKHFYCSHKCSRKAAKIAYQERLKNAGTCSIEGCGNPINRPRHKLCENHYCLLRRNGSPQRKWTVRHRYITDMGYVMLKRPEHPLAMKSGCVFEHRMVAHDKHGGTCPPCHWCGCELTWDRAQVDHLDEIKHNNDPDNLVVSCSFCNRARGRLLPLIDRLRPEVFAQFVALITARHDARTARGE